MTGSAGVIDLSVWQLGLAVLLVGVLVAISARQALGLERDLIVGTVRTIVQLYLVGIILASVFAAARWYWVMVVLIGMTGVATQAAVSRLKKPIPGRYEIATVAIGVSTAVTLAWVIAVVVRVHPWYEPQYVIPIAGMILGNAMTSAALAGDRLQSDLRTRTDEIEAMLALGFSGGDAVRPMVRSAVKAAMIPTVSGMMTVEELPIALQRFRKADHLPHLRAVGVGQAGLRVKREQRRFPFTGIGVSAYHPTRSAPCCLPSTSSRGSWAQFPSASMSSPSPRCSTSVSGTIASSWGS